VLEYKGSEIKEGCKLGTGGFGKVIQGTYYSLKIAIKKIKEYNSKALYREIFIMKKFAHPFIPRLYGIIYRKTYKNYQKRASKSEKSLENLVHIIKSNNSLAVLKPGVVSKEEIKSKDNNKCNVEIILELVEGDSLEKLMKTEMLSNLEKIVILLNLATVLEFLHGFNLMHRDLKPENIMIDMKFQSKLLDFGISKLMNFSNETKTCSAGTMCYMAPENFNLDLIEETDNEEGSQFFQDFKKISSKIDVWAFGCIVHELFTGVKPWSNKVKTNNKILSLLYKKIPFEISPLIKNNKIRNLIEKCVEIDPEKRVSIKFARILLLEILFDSVKENFINVCSVSEDYEDKGMGKILNTFQGQTKRKRYPLMMKVQSYIFDFLRILKKKDYIDNEKVSQSITDKKFLDDYIKQENSNNYSYKENFIKERKKLLSKNSNKPNMNLNLIENGSFNSIDDDSNKPLIVRSNFRAHTVKRMSSIKNEFVLEMIKNENGLIKNESFEILCKIKQNFDNKLQSNREIDINIVSKQSKKGTLYISKPINLEIISLKFDKSIPSRLPLIKVTPLKKNLEKFRKNGLRMTNNNSPFYFNCMNKFSSLDNYTNCTSIEEKKIIKKKKSEEKIRNDYHINSTNIDREDVENERVNIEGSDVITKPQKITNDIRTRIYYTNNILKSSFYLDSNKLLNKNTKIFNRDLKEYNRGLLKNVFLDFDGATFVLENSPDQLIKNRFNVKKTVEIRRNVYH